MKPAVSAPIVFVVVMPFGVEFDSASEFILKVAGEAVVSQKVGPVVFMTLSLHAQVRLEGHGEGSPATVQPPRVYWGIRDVDGQVAATAGAATATVTAGTVQSVPAATTARRFGKDGRSTPVIDSPRRQMLAKSKGRFLALAFAIRGSP